MTLSLCISGQQFIAGRRVASGEATLPGLRAADNEPTGYRFFPASREEVAAAALAAEQAFSVSFRRPPEVRARFLRYPRRRAGFTRRGLFRDSSPGDGATAATAAGRARPYQQSAADVCGCAAPG